MIPEATPDLQRRREIYLRRLRRRCRNREALSDSWKKEVDAQLSESILRMRTESPLCMKRIRRLLNSGAVLNEQFYPHDLDYGFIDPFDNYFERNLPCKPSLYSMFAIIGDLVCSKSTIWFQHNCLDQYPNRIPHHGRHPAYFLYYALMGAGSWGYDCASDHWIGRCLPGTSRNQLEYSIHPLYQPDYKGAYLRHLCWITFRKMVWSAETLYNQGCQHERGLLPGLEKTCWLDPLDLLIPYTYSPMSLRDEDLRYLNEVVNFFLPRLRARTKTVDYNPIFSSLKYLPMSGLSILKIRLMYEGTILYKGKLTYKVKGHPYEKWSQMHAWSEFPRHIFSSREGEKSLIRSVEIREVASFFLQEENFQQVCFKKMRKLLKALLRWYKRDVVAYIPQTLEVMKSKKIQGRKERIIDLLEKALPPP